MTVRELTSEQLSELKSNWFWDVIHYCASEEDEEVMCDPLDPRDFGFPDEIPNEAVFERYDGVCFSSDDFSCLAGQ